MPEEPALAPRATVLRGIARRTGALHPAWALLPAGLLALQIAAFHDLRVDDAYISYRMGQNLAMGHGPVFNPGERVLGSTSPGQVLLVAATYPLFGLEGTPDAMAVLGCIGWTAQALAVYALLSGVLARWAAIAIALAIGLGAAGSAAYIPLETNPTLALVLWAFVCARDERWVACSALCALAFVMRPDTFLAATVLGGAAAVTLRGRILRPLAVAAAIAAPWYLFATFYYGSPMPRTAAAKFQRTELVPYLAHIADLMTSRLFPGGHAILPLAAAWALSLAGLYLLQRRAKVFAWLGLYAGLHLAAYAYLRPFVWHTWHLYPAAVCFIVFGLAAFALAVESRRRALRALASVLGVVLLCSYALQFRTVAASHAHAYWTGGRYTAYRRTVEFLRANAAPDDTFASLEVGTIAYYSGLRAGDLGTLVNTEEAIADPTRFEWAVLDRSVLDSARGLKPIFHTQADGFDVWVYDLEAARARRANATATPPGASERAHR